MPLEGLRWSMNVTDNERQEESADVYADKENAACYIANSHWGPVRLAQKLFLGEILRKYGHRQMRVLDVGTGPGWLASSLALARPTWDVTAVDLSNEMLRFAEESAHKRGASVNWRRAAAGQNGLPDGSVDLVVSHFAFHEFPEGEMVLKEMNRVLAKGGRIEIQDLVRPPKMLLPLAQAWGLVYEAAFKRQYLDSLKAAYTVEEFRQMANGVHSEARVRRRFGVMVRVTIPKSGC